MMQGACFRNLVVAVSGGGRSLENLLRAQSRYGSFHICGVISSRQECRGVEVAKNAKLPVWVHSFPDDLGAAETEKLCQWIANVGAESVALAGFLRPWPMTSSWQGRVINIHPALLPSFGGKGMFGLRVHQAVIESETKTSGATVHFVSEEYDQGAIIAQVRVKVGEQMNAEDLADAVFAAECDLYPKVIDGLIAGRLPLPHPEVLIYDF